MNDHTKKIASRNGATFFLWFIATPTTIIFSIFTILSLITGAFFLATVTTLLTIFSFLFAKKLWRFLHPL